MDNSTTPEAFPTEDINHDSLANTSSIVHPDLPNTTYPFAQDNTTQIEWIADQTIAVLTIGWWMYFAVRILWGCLAIFGNSLVIFAVVKFERLQTCGNYLICNLAISDLLAGLMVPLLIVHKIYSTGPFFIPICLFQKTLSLITTAGNMLSIMYISIDRYIYIDYALRYHMLITPKRTAILLATTWILCLLLIPTIVLLGNHLQHGMPCKYTIFLDDWVKVFYLGPQGLIVVMTTIGFNLAILRIAWRQARQIQAQQLPYNNLDVATHQSTKKISRTLGMVLGMYLLTIAPQAIVSNNEYMSSWDRCTMALYWVNTWVNPLIYAWRLKDFRIAFKKIFTGTGSFIEVPGMPLEG